jgi:hypothetical protein
LALVQQIPGSTTVPVAKPRARLLDIRNEPVNSPGLEFADFAAASGVQVITGDFDGNGRTDVGLVRQRTGTGWTTVPVALSTDTGFTVQNRPAGDFAGFAVMPGVQVVTGGADNGGKPLTDIALVRREPGWRTIPVLLSDAAGFILPPQNRPAREDPRDPAGGEFARNWATARAFGSLPAISAATTGQISLSSGRRRGGIQSRWRCRPIPVSPIRIGR